MPWRVRRLALDTLVGAVSRLVAANLALSGCLLVMAALWWRSALLPVAVLLLSLCAVGLLAMLAAALDAFGRRLAGPAAMLVACVVAQAVHSLSAAGALRSSSLLVGTLVGSLIVVAPVLRAFADADRTLATAL
jgi:hypothetical protein